MRHKSLLIPFLAMATLLLLPSTAKAELLSNWSKELSAGWTDANGNTDKSALSLSTKLSTQINENDLKINGNYFYSTSDGKMDTRKWDTSLTYDDVFGSSDQWFAKYKIEGSGDRFADISWRVLPSVGIGYWFVKNDDFKLSTDASLGYELTYYRGTDQEEEDVVVIGHGYAEKSVFESSTISEDISVIPSLTDDSIRLKSETVFTNPLKENLDLLVKYIVEHDTQPASDKKKTDTLTVVQLKYKF